MKVNMENIFDFESQICTNRQQSEKLLGLGLKKEMADCYLHIDSEGTTPVPRPYREIMKDLEGLNFDAEIVPAWSLHMLIKIGCHKGIGIVVADRAFDSIISLIEKRVQNGVFNKDYLAV